jgi:murein DD-endopeptidase MepM/ murein hydrolase activator NlpD
MRGRANLAARRKVIGQLVAVVTLVGTALVGIAQQASAVGGWATPVPANFTSDSNYGTYLCNGKGTYVTKDTVHLGGDYPNPHGTAVKPIAAGEATWHFNGGTDGDALEVRHTAGDGTVFTAIYGHIVVASKFKNLPSSSNPKGKPVAVLATDTLGTVYDLSPTGSSKGDHLHFGIYENSSPVTKGWGTRPCVSGEPPIKTSKNGDFRAPYTFLNTHPAPGSSGSSSSLEPVTGDWNGDGKTDIGLRRISTGMWYFRTGPTWNQTTVSWDPGKGTDLQPVTGDWNGDGKTDIGLRRISTGMWYFRTGPTWNQTTVSWSAGAG